MAQTLFMDLSRNSLTVEYFSPSVKHKGRPHSHLLLPVSLMKSLFKSLLNLLCFVSAQAQPVLMQYLSPQGTPQQTPVQYIQLLRPIMMVPAKPYQPAKPLGDLQTQNQSQLTSDASSPPPYSTTKPSAWNPYTPFNRQALVGSYSSQYTSYNPRPVIPQANHMSQMNQQLAFDIGLNINEYMPSASSQVSSVVAPRSSLSSYSPYAYKPNKFQPIAQRA